MLMQFHIYKWENLKPDSPHSQTRNQWLYKYGAFARFNGLWFPCKVVNYTTIGEPAQVIPIPIATYNQSIYPKNPVNVFDLDVLYSVFNDGMSIEAYIFEALNRRHITSKMLDAAILRSLNTEIISAPTRLIRQIKEAVNRLWKGEIRIVNTHNKDDINVIDLPHTADIIEKLWNSNDWALQEISQLLGITYNPSHGKKERLIQNEVFGDRDITIMNREMLTSRLITSAEKFGEKVYHISSYIDQNDRGLSPIEGVVGEGDSNAV